MITKPPVSQNFSPDFNLVHFNCGVSSDPSREIIIEWYYKNELIDVAQKEKYAIREDGSLIVILPSYRTTTLAHGFDGPYGCYATDDLSDAYAEAHYSISYKDYAGKLFTVRNHVCN